MLKPMDEKGILELVRTEMIVSTPGRVASWQLTKKANKPSLSALGNLIGGFHLSYLRYHTVQVGLANPRTLIKARMQPERSGVNLETAVTN